MEICKLPSLRAEDEISHGPSFFFTLLEHSARHVWGNAIFLESLFQYVKANWIKLGIVLLMH